jgi:NADP-dependent 3-hydroxy acid dehydrogenase YdfG
MKELSNYFGEHIKEKRIVITGGTTGIGRAVAELLVSLGGRVYTFGRDATHLNDAFEAIKNKYPEGEIYGKPADITKKEDIEMIFKEIESSLGGIDILINNAALGADGLTESSFEKSKYIIDTNIMGYLAFCEEAAKKMSEQKSGHIVNIGSMSAETREETGTIYVATKAAIRGFTAALRKEINPLGIKVTLIEPGSVNTDMQPGTEEERLEKVEKMEMMEADDIAMSVLFCLSQPKRCDVVSLQIRPHLQLI